MISFEEMLIFQVKQYVVDKKQNEMVNRLNKTKTEISTDEFIV